MPPPIPLSSSFSSSLLYSDGDTSGSPGPSSWFQNRVIRTPAETYETPLSSDADIRDTNFDYNPIEQCEPQSEANTPNSTELKTVRYGRGKAIVYPALPEQVQIFESWWSETEFAKQQSKFRWAKTKTRSHVWQHYQEVADSISGVPYVQCLYCSTFLQHPYKGGNGTSSMAAHMKRATCRSRDKTRKNGNIQNMLIAKVRTR